MVGCGNVCNEAQMRYNVTHFIILQPKMPARKSTTLNLRVDPSIKEAIREAALRENRSVANMVETLIRRHCEEAGIPILEQRALFEDEENG